MVAIGPSNDVFCRNMEDRGFRKRITPFSIDDILDKSKSQPEKVVEDKRILNPFVTSGTTTMTKFCGISPGNFASWTPEVHLKWLEDLHKLCSLNAYQPFWFSNTSPYTKLLSTCCRVFASNRPRPYPDPRSPEKLTESSFPFDFFLQNDDTNKTTNNSKEPVLSRPNSVEKYANLSQSSKDKQEVRFQSGSGTESDDGQARERSESTDTSESDSPLSALERLTCVTFKGMEKQQHDLHAVASGRETNKAKRRKCRTAFTAFQLSVLEQRFNCHKYLTPTDRDQIAHVLGLSTSQVITWFQNRRAKQKRDLEEMKNDLKTVEKSISSHKREKCVPHTYSHARAKKSKLQKDTE